jgi:hypothetical protein
MHIGCFGCGKNLASCRSVAEVIPHCEITDGQKIVVSAPLKTLKALFHAGSNVFEGS